MFRTWLIVILTGWLFAVGTLAFAEQAVEADYVPIRGFNNPTGRSVIVAPGDHLWAISERDLRSVLDGDVDIEEITSHWVETIDLNMQSLRSGDPDLIYPGEVVRLPARGGEEGSNG